MGVGGAMSRTAVNSACKVKSPLSGIFTTAVVLVCIFKLSGALYWIPKATLEAIIISAVWPLISSPKVFYTYWKTSLADFISAMLAFWLCLFESTEVGIATAVGFNIVYIVLRQVFTRMSHAGSDSDLILQHDLAPSSGPSSVGGIPNGIRVFRFNESFFYPNAYKLKTELINSVQTHHSPVYSARHGAEAERNWSVQGERQVARLRKKMNISDLNAPRQLSRREREAKEAKDAKERYWKVSYHRLYLQRDDQRTVSQLHEQGKTDQAKSDLARLAKIRAEREAAQARRKAEADGTSR